MRFNTNWQMDNVEAFPTIGSDLHGVIPGIEAGSYNNGQEYVIFHVNQTFLAAHLLLCIR
uniref:Uncharacterized protein n=1 Tax=Rhizophora mucronata TaxID=61149 RepID=A0A2P2JSC8_RHIMU